MSKTDQRVLLMSVAAIAVAGLIMKFGRNLPVISDVAEGYGG